MTNYVNSAGALACPPLSFSICLECRREGVTEYDPSLDASSHTCLSKHGHPSTLTVFLVFKDKIFSNIWSPRTSQLLHLEEIRRNWKGLDSGGKLTVLGSLVFSYGTVPGDLGPMELSPFTLNKI